MSGNQELREKLRTMTACYGFSRMIDAMAVVCGDYADESDEERHRQMWIGRRCKLENMRPED